MGKKREIDWKWRFLVLHYQSGCCFNGFSIFIFCCFTLLCVDVKRTPTQTALPRFPWLSRGRHLLDSLWKWQTLRCFCSFRHWVAAGPSRAATDWPTQFFCLFGVFSMFVCFLFRIYSLIFESCAIVCTVQRYLWDKAAHSRSTIVLLNWTEIRDEWRLPGYHLEGLLSINQPLTVGQQQGAQTGGQFRQITGPNINKKDMNYIAQRCRVTCL